MNPCGLTAAKGKQLPHDATVDVNGHAIAFGLLDLAHTLNERCCVWGRSGSRTSVRSRSEALFATRLLLLVGEWPARQVRAGSGLLVLLPRREVVGRVGVEGRAAAECGACATDVEGAVGGRVRLRFFHA